MLRLDACSAALKRTPRVAMANIQCMPQCSLTANSRCSMHSHLPASLNLRTCYARRPTQARPRQGRALPTVAARCNMQRSQQLTTSPHSTQSCKGVSTPSASVLLTTLAVPLPSMADEAAKVDNAALEAAQQYSTVTFGGSFGQWDPVIAVFFYLVVGSLTVLTLGVSMPKGSTCNH